MTKKSGMHLDRVIAIKIELTGRIDSFIASVMWDQRPQSWALDRMNIQVYKDPRYDKLPAWAKESIKSYFHGKMDMIHRYFTLFAYKVDGKLYRTASGYAEKNWSTPKVDWPHWSQLQAALAAEGRVFMTELSEEYGSYWPNGQPFFAGPPEMHNPKLKQVVQ